MCDYDKPGFELKVLMPTHEKILNIKKIYFQYHVYGENVGRQLEHRELSYISEYRAKRKILMADLDSTAQKRLKMMIHHMFGANNFHFFVK